MTFFVEKHSHVSLRNIFRYSRPDPVYIVNWRSYLLNYFQRRGWECSSFNLVDDTKNHKKTILLFRYSIKWPIFFQVLMVLMVLCTIFVSKIGLKLLRFSKDCTLYLINTKDKWMKISSAKDKKSKSKKDPFLYFWKVNCIWNFHFLFILSIVLAKP